MELTGESKSTCRAALTELRNGLAAELRALGSSQASERLMDWIEAQGISSVMAYLSFRSELNINEVIERCWAAGVEVIVPRCMPADRTMTLHKLKAWDELLPGAYGIMEPDPGATLPLSPQYIPDAIIVPGLAFDETGGRLGYGGGYYDRFAERMKASCKQPVWIGAGFEVQVVEQVPRDCHDLKLDGMVTEKRLMWFGRSE